MREALTIGGLRRAEVVGGAAGLDNEITWVKVMESPDSTDWLRPGELLVTVAYALRDDPEGQASLMERLHRGGASGLVLKPKRYLHEVPQVMIEGADRHGVPLLSIPTDLAYIDIMAPILEHLINAQVGELRQSQGIHRRLTEVALSGRGSGAVADALAGLVGSQVLVEDQYFKLIYASASPSDAEVDDHRRASVAGGGTPRRIFKHPQIAALYAAMRHDLRPRRWPPYPELGLTLPRIVAPVAAGGDILGWVYIIPRPGTSEPLAFMAIEHAATVLALEMVKQREVAEVEYRRRGEFVEDLLDGGLAGQGEAATTRAGHLGYDLRFPCQMLVVDVDHFADHLAHLDIDEPGVQRIKDNLLEAIEAEVQRSHPDAILWQRSDSVLSIIPTSQEQTPESAAAPMSLARRLQAAAQRSLRGPTVSVGIGRPVLRLEDFPEAFAEVRKTMSLLAGLGKRGQVSTQANLGSYRLFLQVRDAATLGAQADEALGALERHDAGRRAALIPTLRAFLASGRNRQAAATQLGVHINTLSYRLSAIERLAGGSLRDADIAFDLELALRIRAFQAE